MARPEANFGERAGEVSRNIGLAGAGIGLIGIILRLPLGGPLTVGGIILAAGGEGLRRASKPKQG